MWIAALHIMATVAVEHQLIRDPPIRCATTSSELPPPHYVTNTFTVYHKPNARETIWVGRGRGGEAGGSAPRRAGLGWVRTSGRECYRVVGRVSRFCGRLRSSFEVSRWCLYSIAYSVTYGSRIW